MTSRETFDKTYFEDGVKAHVSGYENYRWRPEYVLPMANWLKTKFNPSKALDYGCAKGFLVKALRMLQVDAEGYDISQYAIDTCEPEVKGFVSTELSVVNKYDLVIAKDVLEHISAYELPRVLTDIAIAMTDGGNLVVVVPLGDDGRFRIREFELDVTHVTKEDEVWWTKLFNECGFVLEEFYYKVDGVKDNWSQFPTGTGIFILRKGLWDGME